MGLFKALVVGAAIQLGWKVLLAIGEYDDLKSVREFEENKEKAKLEKTHEK